MRWFKWLFSWEGCVQRRHYLVAGATLLAIKYAIDASVAAVFGEPWRIWNYFLPHDISLLGLGREPELYAILWAVAIPFFWAGISLTLRRLEDAGKSAWWVFLFFAPVANLLMFLWLALIPSSPAGKPDPVGVSGKRKQPHGAAVGIALASALCLILIDLATRVFSEYAWGLFLGVPFVSGFVSSWFLNQSSVHSRRETTLVSSVTTVAIGLTLIGAWREGLICVLMALPLAVPFSIAGGFVAWCILARRRRGPTPPVFAAGLAILPLMMMLAEHAIRRDPPVVSVTTSVTIDAPASVVWHNVIAFPPLAQPKELLFRTGVAYPTSAQIIGSGPGAVRYCRFSTGDFVEPITAWEQGRLLAFDVSSQPHALRELSPWKITPPHLERSYMRSRRGQFRLVALSDGRTLLEGTTWYQNFFWPQAYWRAWSDAIVRQIHLRVLQHVKQQSEGQRSTD